MTMRTDVVLLVVGGPAGVGKSTTCRALAGCFEQSVHLPGDDFGKFMVNGWVDQWRPQAATLNEAVGNALGAAAVQLVDGGFTTLLDGHFLPEGVDGLAQVAGLFGIAVHYCVLMTEFDTSRQRAEARGPVPSVELMRGLYGRFASLGRYDTHVVDASAGPDVVAASVLAALDGGVLRVMRDEGQ